MQNEKIYGKTQTTKIASHLFKSFGNKNFFITRTLEKVTYLSTEQFQILYGGS